MNATRNVTAPASDGIASLADLSTEDLDDRLALLDAERAAIRQLLRLRRYREREAKLQQRQQPAGGAK